MPTPVPADMLTEMLDALDAIGIYQGEQHQR
jgi:hypothetical protein